MKSHRRREGSAQLLPYLDAHSSAFYRVSVQVRQHLACALVVASGTAFTGACANQETTPEPSTAQGSGGAGGAAFPVGGVGGVDATKTGGLVIGAGGSKTSVANAGAAGISEGPACGDGLLNQSEERCDDGNRTSGDGCSSVCRIEAYYLCATPGKPCATTKLCGDGQLVGDEECDDGGTVDGDGCSATCALEGGSRCPLPGARCVEICGDSLVVGREACDDGNTVNGDGCSNACRIESDTVTGVNGRPGYWVCTTPGAKCTRATCGDGVKEGAERCDDGNDRPADGCSPDCTLEPQCTASGCASRCGDGIILPGESEECDDGNSLDGDGCSATCKSELGYSCRQVTGSLPAELKIPIVYRDFVGAQRALPSAPVHPDFESTRGTGETPGLVKATLSSAGVPELTGLCVGLPVAGLLTGATDSACPRATIAGSTITYGFNQMSSDAAFSQWYQDVPAVNRTIVSQLCLKRTGTNETYVFDSKTDNPTDCGPAVTCAAGNCWFLPINARGFVAEGLEVDNLARPDVIFGNADPPTLHGNFSFTSVVRTWFIYRGGERLEFSGDDDVWVFINGQRVVDIGGLHGIVNGGVTLDSTRASALGITSGRVYDMSLFHAERYGYGSNFKLTLTGFVSAKTECAPVCGDGVRVGREACDNGPENVPVGSAGSYGHCNDQCELGPRCGDAVVQPDAGEECDDPSAQRMYTDAPGEGCTPACKRPGSCGDGVLQTGFEQCDDGLMNSADPSSYGKCTNQCRLGPYCGDGIKAINEQCDEGINNGKGTCSIGCRLPVLL